MASRDINDLTKLMQRHTLHFLRLAEIDGLDVLIYCTYRSLEEQAKLFRQGRPTWKIMQRVQELDNHYNRKDLADLIEWVGPQYGRRVTNAAPGQSMHNYRKAFDAVPLRNGKPVWGAEEKADEEMWQRYGELVRAAGLEWAGDWVSFTEYPHAQLPGQSWRQLITHDTS